MTGARENVRAALREVARPVATDIRRDRRRRAAVAAVNDFGWTLLPVPALYAATTALAAAAGADARLPWTVLGALWLAVPLALVLRRVRRAGRTAVSDVAALAEIDRELRLEDRLSAAREFVDVEQPDGFRLAAIRDAERRLEAARAARPHAVAPPPRLGAMPFLHAAAGLLLLVTGALLAGAPVAGAEPPPAGQRVASVSPPVAEPPPADAASPRERPNARPPEVQPETAEQQADETAADDSATATETRRGRNPRGAGRSAEARTAAGGGSERGQPSNQAQSTKGRDTSRTKPKEPKPRNEGEEPQREVPPKPQEQSGATQGRGSGRGSSKSPTATPWASKDQVVSDEQQELEEEEEVDDENDESDARGALQPNLRQRKPPVNRDLQISMGGGPPNEDANGRGGPGGPKKQRGVAQLVLGVTFPDHVTSPPSPGMSKVTQERIEPQARESEAVAAEDRGRREQPIGHLSRRVLSPWMQDLVRKFSLSLRSNRRPE